MNISIKSKLYIGIGLLAGFVVLLWISGSVFINTLAENSGAIIQDNIRSVTYAQQMEQALSEIYTAQIANNVEENSYKQNVKRFENILNRQEANITEAGEQELTKHLRKNYENLLARFQSARNATANVATMNQRLSPAYQRLQQNLSQLTNMNVDAIHRKNEAAQQTASNVTIYMTVIGALCSVLGIIMLIRFPSYIVDPIHELISRIKNIANHNYDQTLEFQTGDEYEELAAAFNQMATKLQDYENSNLDRLMSEKKRVETIINHMSDAVIGLNADNYMLFANEKAVELIGKQKEQLIGQYAPDVASHNDLFHKVIKTLTGDNEEELGYLKTGEDSEHYYSIEIVPVHQNEKTGQESHLGNIITLKNVTRFHELDQAKTNFISVVSHELKTPISSIKMSLRLLDDERIGTLNTEQKELVSNIGKDVTRMKRTTSDLLDLSKIESGNIQLNTEEVVPGDLLEYAYETMLMQVNQNDLHIEYHIEENLPKIQADPKKTVWVLVNLISNAIRYTDSGGAISLDACTNEGRDYIRYSVKDTGSGIAEEDLNRIFEKYYQINSAQKDQFGSGLGLSIAKEFITAQGGKIWAESTLGEGSRFHFILPINNYIKA